MKKKMIKIASLLGMVLLNVVLFGAFVFAGAAAGNVGNLDPLKSQFGAIQRGIQYVAGTVVVVSAAVTAIMFMSSVVNPNAKKTAKEALVAMLIGVVILALSGNAVDILNSFFSSNVLTN